MGSPWVRNRARGIEGPPAQTEGTSAGCGNPSSEPPMASGRFLVTRELLLRGTEPAGLDPGEAEASPSDVQMHPQPLGLHRRAMCMRKMQGLHRSPLESTQVASRQRCWWDCPGSISMCAETGNRDELGDREGSRVEVLAQQEWRRLPGG